MVDPFLGEAGQSVEDHRNLPDQECCNLCNIHCVYRLTLSNISATCGQRRPPHPQKRRSHAVDVVALGESMVTFLPSRPGRLADVPAFHRSIGGAESNVACALAAAYHTTRWVSRVGADGFGDHLVEAIGGYGVDVSHVRRDPDRPTGVYFRTAGDRADDAHEVAYYRAGSAASAMSPTGVDLDAVRAGRVLHLSGITAALSEDCLTLLRELTAPTRGAPDLLRREPPPGPVGRGIRPGGFAGPGPECGHRLRGRGRGGGSLGPDGRSDGHPGGAPRTDCAGGQAGRGGGGRLSPPSRGRSCRWGDGGPPLERSREWGGRARTAPRGRRAATTPPAQPQPTAPSNPPQEST